VIVTEGEFRVHGDGRVESALAYIRFSQEADLPDEVMEQINNYEPERQCVFAMVDSGGKAAVLTLNAQKLASTPKRLYEKYVEARLVRLSGRREIGDDPVTCRGGRRRRHRGERRSSPGACGFPGAFRSDGDHRYGARIAGRVMGTVTQDERARASLVERVKHVYHSVGFLEPLYYSELAV